MDIYCKNTMSTCFLKIATQLSTDQVLIAFNDSLPDTYSIDKSRNS